MTPKPTRFVVQSFAPGLNESGFEIDFVNAAGEHCAITLPGDHLAQFLLAIESGAAQLFEMAKEKLKGYDPRLFGQITGLSCRRIDVAWTEDGRIVLAILSDKGMPLNLAMDQAKAQGLAQRIQAALQDQSKGGPRPS